MAPRKFPPVEVAHRIGYERGEPAPLYRASCHCGGWTSEWNRDFMAIERAGRSHLRAIQLELEGRSKPHA